MPSSAFEKRFQEYSQILAELTGSQPMVGAYMTFISSLEQLNQTVSALDQKDESMTAQEIRNLQEQYNNALRSTNQYLSQNATSSLDRKLNFIAKEFRELIVKDLEVINGLDPRNRCSMRQAFDVSRTLRLDITGREVNHVGAYMSDRIPVAHQNQDGIIRKGFFTKRSLHGENAILERFRNDYPQYEAAWSLLEDYENSVMLSKALEEGLLFFKDEAENPLRGLSDDERRELRDDNNFYYVIKAYRDEYESIRGSQINYHYIQATKGSSIQDRNCAMTSVATALGVDSLIAHSEKAVLRNGSEIVKGCFTAHVTGSDIFHMGSDDPMRKWCSESKLGRVRIRPNVIKQFADLQILDFICGNVDRHGGNMLYQFEEGPNGPVLSGIVGIDNDMSFGALTAPTNFNCVLLQDMNVISQSMADMVMSLDRGAVDFLLQNYELSKEEKDAMYQRLEMTQAKILEGQERFRNKAPGELEIGYLRTVPDNEFGQYNIDQLRRCKDHKNLFTNLMDITVPEISKRRGSKKPTPIRYTDAVEGCCQPLTLQELPERFADMNRQLKELSKDFLFANSSAFKAMEKAMSHVMNPKDTDNATELLNDLQNKIQGYITEKSHVPRREAGRARVHLARQMRDRCGDVLQEFLRDQHPTSQRQRTTVDKQIQKNIQNRTELCRQRSAAALEQNNMVQVIDNIAETVYLATFSSMIQQNANENILDQLADDVMKKGLSKMRPTVEQFVRSLNRDDLEKMVNSNHFSTLVNREYLQFSMPQPKKEPPKAGVTQTAPAKSNPGLKSLV